VRRGLATPPLARAGYRPRGGGYSSGTGRLTQPPRPNPSRGWRNPADQGPPLEDIDRVIARAELAADLEWRVDHGDLPWEWPVGLFPPDPRELDDRLRDVMLWPRRWFAEHLFELPPLGMVPPQWLALLA